LVLLFNGLMVEKYNNKATQIAGSERPGREK
jgi:hypothetical protein